jgi:hypothetical protein
MSKAAPTFVTPCLRRIDLSFGAVVMIFLDFGYQGENICEPQYSQIPVFGLLGGFVAWVSYRWMAKFLQDRVGRVDRIGFTLSS